MAGEPEVAEWHLGQILLRYTFDPVSILRVMHLDGPEAPAVPPVRKLVTRLPQLTEPQVLAGLDSSDDVICLRDPGGSDQHSGRAAGLLSLPRSSRARLGALNNEPSTMP